MTNLGVVSKGIQAITGVKVEKDEDWEKIREDVRAVAGSDISVGFAQEIVERYPPEKISSAIKELRRQVDRGVEIRSVGAWLRYALENEIQPDKPAVRKLSPKKSDNRTPRAGPKFRSESNQQKQKKKEFLRSLVR